MVEKKYFIDRIDGVLALLRKEILRGKPMWCPSFIYLWWIVRKVSLR